MVQGGSTTLRPVVGVIPSTLPSSFVGKVGRVGRVEATAVGSTCPPLQLGKVWISRLGCIIPLFATVVIEVAELTAGQLTEQEHSRTDGGKASRLEYGRTFLNWAERAVYKLLDKQRNQATPLNTPPS